MASQSDIIRQLSNSFHLSQNQTDILLFLCRQDATATEILAHTSVSNGRIYRLLSELVTCGLVTKISGHTATYSLKNFDQHLNQFMNQAFSEFTHKQKQILESLATLHTSSNVEVLTGTKEDFDAEIIRFLDQARDIKILHKDVSLPWFFYAHDADTFATIRGQIKKTRLTGSSDQPRLLEQKRQAYLRTYRNKPVTHLMSTTSATDFCTRYPRFLPHLKNHLKLYRTVKINIIDQLHNPFSTYISDKAVLQVMFFGHSQRLLRLTGSDIIDTYHHFFSRYLSSSRPLSTVLHPIAPATQT